MIPSQLPIDPGEKILLAIGIQPVLSKGVEKITKAQLAVALRTNAMIRAGVRSIFAGTTEIAKVDRKAYNKLLDELTRPYQERQVQAMIASFPAEARASVGMPFQNIARKAFEFLLSKLPRSVSKSYVGSKNLQPSDPAYFQFLGILTVVNDPMSVFGYIGKAMLLRSQMEAIRFVYPTISAEIDTQLMNASIDFKAEKKSYQLPGKAEIGLATWEGNPIDVQRYQMSYAVQNKKPAGNKPQETALSKSALTGAQKATYGTIGE